MNTANAGSSSLAAKDGSLIRRQALLSGIISLVSGLIYFAAEFPFPKVIATIAITASVFYFAFYLFFEQIDRICYRGAGVFLSVMAVVSLSLVINFSGGIVSPFIFFYFCILISESLYGLENQLTLPVALGGYLTVVFGQFFGLVNYANAWAADVYRSKVATILIAGSTAAYMVLTRYITQIIVRNLRAKIDQEEKDKSVLLKKFSELNSSSQLGVLAHRIAHDLRGPISSISGYLQIEMTKPRSQEDMAALKDVEEVVIAMAASLNGITRFGKSQPAKVERIELADFMGTLLGIVAFAPQSQGVRFVKLYPPKLQTSVKASRSDLQQAYFNILKNSVEAVRDNADERTVQVDIKVLATEVEISILDNGPGIVPEILESLFKKSITTKKDGTGVGLVITRDLLAINDGTIELANRAEGGLRVTTRLPLA